MRNRDLPRGWKKIYPWRKHWLSAISRCRCKKTIHFKKGIRVRISLQELKKIWKRDRAQNIRFPALDRIDPTGDYHAYNCRFISMTLNRKRCRYIPKQWSVWKHMEDQPVRISARLMIPIRKLATKEGRSVKNQTERLIEAAFALLADQDVGLNSTPWKNKTAKRS